MISIKENIKIPDRVSNPVRGILLFIADLNRHKILWRYMCG